jgi:hypothetical protein
MTEPPEQAAVEVPLDAFLKVVRDQRNAALDEAAQWRAAFDQKCQELKLLEEENERLRGQVASQSGAAPD